MYSDEDFQRELEWDALCEAAATKEPDYFGEAAETARKAAARVLAKARREKAEREKAA